MKTKLLMERLDAIERQALETLKEVRAMREDANEQQSMTEEDNSLRRWYIPNGYYSVLAEWLISNKASYDYYGVYKRTWQEVAKDLSADLGWDVEWVTLCRAYNRKNKMVK